MKVVLVEPNFHHEVLGTFIDFLRVLNVETKVITHAKVLLFIQESINQHPRLTCSVFEQGKVINQLSHEITMLSNDDIVIFVTLTKQFRRVRQILRSTNAVFLWVVHNLNTVLIPLQSIWTVYECRHDRYIDLLKLSYFVATGRFRNQAGLLREVQGIGFPGCQLLSYGQTIKPDMVASFTKPIPFVFYEGQARDHVREEEFNLVIPGRVEFSHRNYQSVYEVLAQLSPLPKKVNLIFAGRVNAKTKNTILQLMYPLNGPHLSVHFFDTILAPDAYRGILEAANLLWLPLKRQVKNALFMEQVGYSKISGAINDGIRYGIPMMIPAFYPIEPSIAGLFLPYETVEEGVEQIRLLLNVHTTYHIHTQIQKEYSLPQQASRFYQVLKEVIVRRGS